MQFNRPDGKTCPAYYVEPTGAGDAPGVVLIQEWWGVNDQIKGVADRLTRAGYRVLIPDLYRGNVAVEAKEAEHLMGQLNFGDAASQDIRGAVTHLKASSPKVAVMGFCMGGALTVLSAVNVPEADAAVCYYGYPPLEYVDASKIKCPLLGHFAIEDAYFPIAVVDELENKLRSANVSFEFHRYAAKHAFANETLVDVPIAAAYDSGAAITAWIRTMDFLGKHLKPYWA